MIQSKKIKLLIRYLKEKKLYTAFVRELIQSELPLETIITAFNKQTTISGLYHMTMSYSKYILYIVQSDFEEFFLKKIYGKTKLELFDDFLKKFNLYDKFYENLIKLNPKKPIEIIVNDTDLSNIINVSFTWKKTNEGFNFWQNQHFILQDYYDKISQFE